MRSGVGLDPTWDAALAKSGITTGILARMEFESGSAYVWTGPYALPVSGTGDALCDGKTFEPISEGVLVDVGSNDFSLSGSEALPITMAIPEPPVDYMIEAVSDASEWQGRMCYLWRIVVSQAATASSPQINVVKRVRAGAMDDLRINNDGSKHTLTLLIEGHASMISNASGSTYLDQQSFDPADTSQAYAVAIANNPRLPSRGSYAGGGYSGGGGGSFKGIVTDIYREQQR